MERGVQGQEFRKKMRGGKSEAKAPQKRLGNASRFGSSLRSSCSRAVRCDATLLDNGDVLIAGGYASQAGVGGISHAWLYRP